MLEANCAMKDKYELIENTFIGLQANITVLLCLPPLRSYLLDRKRTVPSTSGTSN